jgi:gas vesicle protein
MVHLEMDLSVFADPTVGNAVGSAVGALAGAYAAFLLEARRRKKENTETQRSRLLHAQFLFAQKINSITNLKNHPAQIRTATAMDSINVSKMSQVMIEERISARDLEPMIEVSGRTKRPTF